MAAPHRPGQAPPLMGPQPGAPDCTILVSDTSAAAADQSKGPSRLQSKARRPSTAGSASAPLSPRAGDDDSSRPTSPLSPRSAAYAAVAAARRRTHYVDWLRLALTVLVVVHHCVTTYLTQSPWAAKKGDDALWLLVQLFVNGNQSYFMTLFFLLSGIYVPGSYRRKGAARFLADRALRLLVPCLVYSFLAPPLIAYWTDLTKWTQGTPRPTLAAAYEKWLKPGWPTNYVLPTGPPWFVWMLWWFNVLYALARLAGCCTVGRELRRRLRSALQRPGMGAGDGKGVGDGKGAGPLRAPRGRYTIWETALGAGVLTLVLTVLAYAARVLDFMAFQVRPATFVTRGPFVAFMPDFAPVYFVAFVLGIVAGPGMLARLPKGVAGWCLGFGGVYWTLAGWVPSIALFSMLSFKQGTQAFLGAWAFRTFVEQSFCVIWSLGLLVLFRDAFNAKPGRVGAQLIGGAYAAYLVHPLVIILMARALMAATFISSVVNAAIIAVPTVTGSWLVAMALRAIPGAHRVL